MNVPAGRETDGFMDTWRGEDFLTFIKLLQAKCTNKVFGVEFPELLKEHESEKNWL